MLEEFFARAGFAIVPAVLSAGECADLAVTVLPTAAPSGGTRCLLSQPWCAALARRLRGHPMLSPLIPAELVAVQCTYFEKSAARNWLVPWHQDLSIPVAERVDDPALRGWTEKEGSLFVQAPAEILEQMVAVRVHLEACTVHDGPLRVVSGSHRRGRLTPEATVEIRAQGEEAVCSAERGDALVLRPLLLHASSKATGTSRRRVLHFLFGPRLLPLGLRWHHAL
jgi:hypothetical protein